MPDYINRADIMAFPIRADHCDRQHANEHFINGIETVMEYVGNLKPVPVVSRALLDQIRWERDVAIEQLNKIGKELGEKMDDVAPVVRCKDCKFLMFSDCYGECRRGHFGIVSPNDYCSGGVRKDDVSG